MAIPFQSLSYDDDVGLWGFEFSRTIARKNEEVRWSSTNPALDFTDVSEAGTLTGITNVNQGIGLDVQVYGALRIKRDWHIEGEDTGISFTAGGNAFYKITPALTGTLTFNPDFSDAPLDVRQVNTSRFDLFFPETRDFFLQDAGAFEFGGVNFAGDDRGRQQRQAVLLAQYRPRRRRAGEHHRRRQDLGRIWRVRDRRTERLYRQNGNRAGTAAVGVPHHAPGARAVESGLHIHQRRSDRSKARTPLPEPTFSIATRNCSATRPFLRTSSISAAFRTPSAMTIRSAPRSHFRTSRGRANLPSRRSAPTSFPRSDL